MQAGRGSSDNLQVISLLALVRAAVETPPASEAASTLGETPNIKQRFLPLQHTFQTYYIYYITKKRPFQGVFF
jgi:hypothetical protein